MKNKILTANFLIFALLCADCVFAANQISRPGNVTGNNPGQPAPNAPNGTQNQILTQTANQGANDQIQTQTQIQTEPQNRPDGEQIKNGPENATQENTPRNDKPGKMGDENPNGHETQNGSNPDGQAQNQNQIQNQGEEKQIQNEEQQNQGNQNKNGSNAAGQNKSQVAAAVEQMLQLADRNGGIGEQVRAIAQTQTQNDKKIQINLEKIQSRNAFAKFFIGANYGEIKNAQKTLEQNREQIRQLNEIRNQLANEGDQQILAEQIQTLEQANSQAENSLNELQKGFSLFGWVFKMFVK